MIRNKGKKQQLALTPVIEEQQIIAELDTAEAKREVVQANKTSEDSKSGGDKPKASDIRCQEEIVATTKADANTKQHHQKRKNVYP